MDQNFLPKLKKAATIFLYVMLFVILASLALGSLHLITIVIEKILSPDPYIGLLNVMDLMDIFSMVLTIGVGYELFKSISIIIKSDIIPAGPIIKIGTIAVANKIITLDIKNIDSYKMIALGILIICMAIGYYFFNKSDQETRNQI